MSYIEESDYVLSLPLSNLPNMLIVRFVICTTPSPQLDCDNASGQDMAVTQGTSRVIYAFHEDDGDADDADSISYHGSNRGSDSVNMWYGEGDTVELEDDVDYFDLTMTNWSMAAVETGMLHEPSCLYLIHRS